MLARNNKSRGASVGCDKPEQSPVPSIISANLKMTGDLKSDGEIQVDGKVVGNIRTKTLLIGKTANVNGKIVADSVLVYGNVNGQIKAPAVTLAKTAHVVGDILHESLSIETGAFLEGVCKRMTESKLNDGTKLNLVEGGDDIPAEQIADTQKVAS